VPALDEPVEDGDRVAVRRARPLDLVVDGEPRQVWVTAASVDEALDQVGLREPGLALSASRSRELPLEGFRLDVTTPKDVVVLVDGGASRHQRGAHGGRAALGCRHRRRPQDRLSKYPTEAVVDGDRIRVVRVATTRATRNVEVPFGTERREDAAALTGTSTTLQAGKPGVVEETVETVTADGAVEKSTVLSRRTLSEPVTRVVVVGTQPRPAPAPRPAGAAGGSAGPTAGGSLNWAGLAACESGGNPGAVSSTGKYRGLYQFSMATWAGVGGSGDPAPPARASRRCGRRCCTPGPVPGSGRPAGAGCSARQDAWRPGDCSARPTCGRWRASWRCGRPRRWVRTSSSTPTRSAAWCGPRGSAPTTWSSRSARAWDRSPSGCWRWRPGWWRWRSTPCSRGGCPRPWRTGCLIAPAGSRWCCRTR
jgi:uncharacterized protein YabE (DUF348 family)